jgi:hypothetical protein
MSAARVCALRAVALATEAREQDVDRSMGSEDICDHSL